MEIYGIRDKNHAMLCKWLWRFSAEKKVLWRKVLVMYREVELVGGWKLRIRAAREGSVVVKALVRLGNGGGRTGEVSQNRIRLLVRNGNRVLFWKDKWVGESPLMESFPKLYMLGFPP